MILLSDPIEIRNLKVRNRIVMPPMATETATGEGYPTQRTLEHYLARAKAKVGLIVFEHAYVLPEGKVSPHQLGIYSDDLIISYKEIVDEIKAYGAAAALQISHGGGAVSPEVTGSSPVAPSKVMHPNGHAMPKALDTEGIQRTIEAFLDAAVRVKRSGFDMVQIHSAHGYLLSQFLSPITNKRTDDFGLARSRVLLDILTHSRKRLGDLFPIMVRLGAQDQYPEGIEPDPRFHGGLTLKEGVEVARLLEAEGADLLDISGGLCGSRPQEAPPAYFLPWQETIRKAVNIPVVATGGITDPLLARKILAEEKADMVGIGRAMLKNPHWAEEALRN